MNEATELGADIYGNRDQSVATLARTTEALARLLGKSLRAPSREDAVKHGPAAPADVEDDSTEEEERRANEEVDRERFHGAAAEPRDEEDAIAQRVAAKRQQRVASKSRDDDDEDEEDEKRERKARIIEDEDERHGRKSRRDEDEEEDRHERKSRHGEDCECSTCKARKSRARKAKGRNRGFDDDAEEAIGDSQKAYIYDEDWASDDEDLHGYFDDPAEEAAEGHEGNDKVTITNMGRRLRAPADSKEGHRKSRASGAFFRDIAKSRRTAAIVDASDELNYLTEVLATHLDSQDAKIAELGTMVKSMASVVVDLAKANLSEVDTPDTGISTPGFVAPSRPAVRKGGRVEKGGVSATQIQGALLKSLGTVASADNLQEFDAWMQMPQAQIDPNAHAREWLDMTLETEQIQALGLA